MEKRNTLILENQAISINDIVAVARQGFQVEFSKEYKSRVQSSHVLLNRFVSENRLIYGVTTGFGQNVETAISPDEALQLQTNIVRSHAAAVGDPIEKDVARAYLLMMLINTGRGYSGISLEALTLIKGFLNHNIVPFAPGEGSVGYLAVEGYFAMALIGEGKVWLENELMEVQKAMALKGLTPIKLKNKEGLTMLSGSMMACAYASLGIYDLIVAGKNLDLGAGLSFEALRGTINSFDKRLHQLKNHQAQVQSAALFRKLLNGSQILENCKDNVVQDCYTLRCTGHIHGAAKKIIYDAKQVIMNEINSVTDNPVLYPDTDFTDGEVLMGGNFDGSFISIYCDSAALGACTLARLADKRMDRIVTPNLSGLPAFLVRNPGLNSGYMIPQYTVSGLFSEISNLSTPVTLQSISTCTRQEEPVSLAYLSAKKLFQIGKKLAYIASIEMMMSVQGLDLIKPLLPSTVNQKIHTAIRQEVSELVDDRCYHEDIEFINKRVRNGEYIDIAEQIIGTFD